MKQLLSDTFYMRTAIMHAKKARDSGEVPVGAIVSYKGDMLVASYNNVESLKDPTAHAEILAIRAAAAALGTKNLSECDIYVTLEPCVMCAHALSLARIRRIYFGAYDARNGALEGHRLFHGGYHCYKPEVYGGIFEEECSGMITRFFEDKRA